MHPRTIALLVVFVCLGVGVLAVGATANHGSEPINYTVFPDDRTPDAETTHVHEVEYNGTIDNHAHIAEVEQVIFVYENDAFDIDGCEGGFLGGDDVTLEVEDRDGQTEAFSFDEAIFDGNAIQFDIDDGPPFRNGETLRLEFEGCAVNADEEGWYRSIVNLEGEAFTDEQSVEFTDISHYFGLCEGCESDDDARESIGPSPTDPTPTPTATPTPTPTPTPEPTPEPTPTATPPEQQTPEPTPTATPEPTPEPSPEPTPTPTDSGDSDDTDASIDDDVLYVIAFIGILGTLLVVFGFRRL